MDNANNIDLLALLDSEAFKADVAAACEAEAAWEAAQRARVAIVPLSGSLGPRFRVEVDGANANGQLVFVSAKEAAESAEAHTGRLLYNNRPAFI